MERPLRLDRSLRVEPVFDGLERGDLFRVSGEGHTKFMFVSLSKKNGAEWVDAYEVEAIDKGTPKLGKYRAFSPDRKFRKVR